MAFTLRTVTNATRQDVLRSQLELAEREYIMWEAKEQTSPNPMEVTMAKEQLVASQTRIENLQEAIDQLETEAASNE